MRIIVILAVLAAPALGAAQEAEEPEDTRITVVVVPLSSKPAIPGIEVLTEELRTQVARHGGYRLVTPEEMNAIDGELQRQLAGGCDEASCIAELGGALGARYLITGRIGKLGSTFSLNIKLIDIERVSAANAASAHGKSVEEFLMRMPAITTQLLGAPTSGGYSAVASSRQPSKKKKVAAKKSNTLAERLSKAFGGNSKTSAKTDPAQPKHIKHSLMFGFGLPPGLGLRYEFRPGRRIQLELDAGALMAVGIRVPIRGRLDQGGSLNIVAKTATLGHLMPGESIFDTGWLMHGLMLSGSYKLTFEKGIHALGNLGGGVWSWSSSLEPSPFFEFAVMIGKNF